MTKPLFENFDKVSAKQWKQKIQFDLKGLDYNETLVWKSNDDISVKPFYHADDFTTPHLRPNTKATQWEICECIYVADVGKSNQQAINSLNRGAESIKFIIPSEDIPVDDLLKGIDLSSTGVHFEFQFLSLDFIKKLSAFPTKAGIQVNNDIIGNLAKQGNFFFSLNEDFKRFEDITAFTKSFSVDLSLYQNSGANMVQQLAYGLAHANEYLNHLNNSIFKGKELNYQSLEVLFNVSVGTNYFFEIAKLRALRILWDRLSSEYNCNSHCHIMVTPTKRNKTIYEYNNNMLRTTTECMSAIMGGANTICNLPYDSIYHKSNHFGTRIARNQLLILKHESYFDKVDNPSDGAYYIESLTNQLAEKALKLFKDIEANGGFLRQLKAGTVQRKIKESASKEQQDFINGHEVLLGTNKHPNIMDKMKHELELYPFVKTKPRKTLIEPIIEKRLAETLEKERLNKE